MLKLLKTRRGILGEEQESYSKKGQTVLKRAKHI
jgi:hypothetical protein